MSRSALKARLRALEREEGVAPEMSGQMKLRDWNGDPEAMPADGNYCLPHESTQAALERMGRSLETPVVRVRSAIDHDRAAEPARGGVLIELPDNGRGDA